MTGHVRVVDRCPSPEEALRRIAKAEEVKSRPFERLPGFLSDHKVLAVIDGHKIRVRDIEMVWNDHIFIDHVMGEGYYRKTASSELMVKALDLAEKLYAGGIGDSVCAGGE